MEATQGQLLAGLSDAGVPGEFFDVLLQTPTVKLERITSVCAATPDGEWYDQDWNEWVLLLQGAAGLRIEDRADVIELKVGDYVLLPAHCRHRVEWTDPSKPTVWLALHYAPSD